MRVESSIFLVAPNTFRYAGSCHLKGILSIVTGFDCSRLKTVSVGLSKATVEGKEGYEDYSRCSLVVRPEYRRLDTLFY
jgi:hypothetical protein